MTIGERSSPMPMRDQDLAARTVRVTLEASVIAAGLSADEVDGLQERHEHRGLIAPPVGDRELNPQVRLVDGRRPTPGQGTTLEDSGTTVTPRPAATMPNIAPPVSPCSTTAG